MQALERRIEAAAEDFKAAHVAEALWGFGTLRHVPSQPTVAVLLQRVVESEVSCCMMYSSRIRNQASGPSAARSALDSRSALCSCTALSVDLAASWHPPQPGPCSQLCRKP